jgi:hypothetical protein
VGALDKEALMALARVVTFDGVSRERMDQQMGDMERPPEGVEAKEVIVLHDAEAEKSVVILLFDSDDAYQRSDEVLNAMSAGDTPGQRTSVGRYDVVFRDTM